MIFAREMTKNDEAKLWEDAAWLRRLALALVRDVSLAEDLVQEVWLAALQARPRFKDSARPWLAKVARNLVRSMVRSAHSHDRWQRLSPAADQLPSPEALITHQEALRILQRLVTELDEPYRSTILLCYGEGLTPSQVAHRLGLAPGTIRWRLKLALDRLRDQLDSQTGRRRRGRSFAVLGIWPRRRSRARAWAVRAWFTVGVTALMGGAALVGVTAGFAARPDPAASQATATSIDQRRRGATSTAPRLRSGLWFAPTVASSSGIPAWVAQPGLRARRVAGRVLEGGAPLAGARVVLGHQLARYGALAPLQTASDRDGRFDFGPQLATKYTVMAEARGRAIAAIQIDLRRPDGQQAAEALQLTVRPCTHDLHGRILDSVGLPIAGARVLASGLLGAISRADGSYQLCVQAGKLDTRVEASGYGTVLIKADVTGRLRRDVVLVPHAALAGRVIQEDGEPVESAHVRAWRTDPGPRERFIGPISALTDAAGRFQIQGLEPGRWLFAADAAGAAAAPSVERALPPGWSERAVILSVRRAVQVVGRVLERGRPVVGATVSLISIDGGTASDSARTQPDGAFVIDRVQPGAFRAIVRGYLVVQPGLIHPAPRQHLSISVERS